MIFSTDQLGKSHQWPETPKRVVSLVPSITELLHFLGLKEEVVGITKFCEHPEEWFRSKPRIGGTKNPDIEKIMAIRPDIIIANKEENKKEAVEKLSAAAPVWTSDVRSVAQALEMINRLGALFQKEQTAKVLCNNIYTSFQRANKLGRSISVLYLIWQNPLMSISPDTFIFDVLKSFGFNVKSAKAQGRYPIVEIDEIKELAPEWILLSSEPYPFGEKERQYLQQCFPESRVCLIDGSMMSWYGSRLQHTSEYLQKWMNAQLQSAT